MGGSATGSRGTACLMNSSFRRLSRCRHGATVGVTVHCATVIETTQGTFTSSDRATWASGDRRANANRTLLPPTERADDSVPDVVSVVGNRGAPGVDAV